MRGNNNLNSVLLETYKSLSTDVSSNIVSFPQFLQSIVSGHQDLSRNQWSVLTSGAALHWLPYYLQCNPCHPQYPPHTIIHLDTWSQDTSLLLNNIGVDSNR